MENSRKPRMTYGDGLITYWWQDHELVDLVSIRRTCEENLENAKKSAFRGYWLTEWLCLKRIEAIQSHVDYWNGEIEKRIRAIESDYGSIVVRKDGVEEI